MMNTPDPRRDKHTDHGDGSPAPGECPAGTPQRTQDPNTLSVVAMVLGGIGLLVLPVAIGVAGIVCAAIAKCRGERFSTAALIVAISGTVGGIILGYAVGKALYG